MNTINYLPYSDTLEKLEPDEAATIAALVSTLRSISETTFKNCGHAQRSVHAKSHALLYGELTILETLAVPMRQGLFQTPGTYPVVLRFSSTTGDILPDSVSVPRGLAIKVNGTTGARLPGSENAATQDFVLVNGPAFLTPDAKGFLKSLKMLAPTTDKGVELKKAASVVLRGTEQVVEAFGGESPTLKGIGGHPETHPLGETYFSQVPLRYGDYVAKIALKPVSPLLLKLIHAPVDLSGKPDGLREAMIEFFANHGGTWDLQAQLCTGLESMPIEDASVVWPENESPYVTVARLTVSPQEAWNPVRAAAIDDGLAFSPWHGLAAHRPLGSVMRARKAAYEMSAQFRSERNKKSVAEPMELATAPG